MMVLRGRTPVSVLQRLQCVYKTSTFDLLETAHSPASNPCKQNGNQFWSSALQGRSENLDGSVCLSSPQVPRSACGEIRCNIVKLKGLIRSAIIQTLLAPHLCSGRNEGCYKTSLCRIETVKSQYQQSRILATF